MYGQDTKERTPCWCVCALHHPGQHAQCPECSTVTVTFQDVELQMCRPCAALATAAIEVHDALELAAAAEAPSPVPIR